MEFFEVIRGRRAVRAFQPTAIPAEMLETVLASANAAPSACNLQAYEIYVVTDERQRKALAEAARHQSFLAGAPVLLVFCTHAARSVERYAKRGEILFTIQDATIACTFAMLAATALGLATVWIGSFDAGEVARIAGAPTGVEPVAILPLGYAAEEPPQPARRPLEDLVHRAP
jgi:nitroreductase